MTHTNWRERFEYEFQTKNDKYGRERFADELNLPKKVKDFIQAEIDKAVLEEREKITTMIDNEPGGIDSNLVKASLMLKIASMPWLNFYKTTKDK